MLQQPLLLTLLGIGYNKMTKRNFKKFLKKYSLVANVLSGLSATGIAILAILANDLSYAALLIVSAVLLVAGVTGHVWKEEIEEDNQCSLPK